MPTIVRMDGLRLVIWTNDHSPPHVHVFSGDAEAKIALGDPGMHPTLVENLRMKPSDLAKALKAVFAHQELLRQRWREIHE